IAPVGGQIEGDRQALLTGGQVAAIEGVGLFSGREARILADGPRRARIHGRIGPAHERSEARQAVDEVQPLDGPGAVGGLDRQTFGRGPRRALRPGAGGVEVEVEGDLGEVRETHWAASSKAAAKRTGDRASNAPMTAGAAGAGVTGAERTSGSTNLVTPTI